MVARGLAGEWREGLEGRFAEDGCSVAAEALERIIELGEPHPRTTMLIAQQTHLASIEADTHEIDLGWRSAAGRSGDRVASPGWCRLVLR